MGGSQSSGASGDYKKEIKYYNNFDSRPILDQDYLIVEPEHFSKILKGEYSDLFEDEDVEHVWIYYCPLGNLEGAKIGTTVLGSVAGVAGILSFVPGINLIAIPIAAATGIGAVLSGVTGEFLNHQFVMFKTKKWLYVVAKGASGCEFYRGTENIKEYMLDTQKQFDEATRPLQETPTPKVYKEDKGKGRLFDMIRWMHTKQVIEKVYHFSQENCKDLAKPLFNCLARSEEV